MREKHITYCDLIVFISMILFFGAIFFLRSEATIADDMMDHLTTIQGVANGNFKPPANFLFYLSVYIGALFNTEILPLKIAATLVLAFSVTAKFTITRILFIQYFRSSAGKKDRINGWSVDGVIIPVICVLLLIVFSLPTTTDFLYIGQIPPNVWHNSTVIFVMPFSLLLFWLSYQQLMQPGNDKTVQITILCVLNILIKPSFFLVFLFAYPLMLLKNYGLERYPWRKLMPIMVGAIVCTMMYYLIYTLSYGNIDQDQSGIALRPFWVWSNLSSNIVLSIAASLVFPIVYIAIYRNDLTRQPLLQYAVITYLIAVAIAALLTEIGPREFHGNFFWQAIISSYILFFVTSALFFGKLASYGISNWKNISISLAFILHVLAGIAYLVRFFYAGDYL